MFWGLIMEPQRRYTQKVKRAFHISMASLDVSTSSDDPAQVMCGFEGRNYLLCTLRKPDVLQVPLDLNFEVGDELSLAANGKCHVHLTGYLTDDFDEEIGDEEVEEEEEVVEKKKKKNKKKNKMDIAYEPPLKKTKVSGSDDNEEDDDSYDMKTLLNKSLVETDEDDVTFTSEDEAEEEEDDDEDLEESGDIEEDEENSLSEDDSDGDQPEEPPKKTRKSKQNGLINKSQEKLEQPTTPKQKEKEKKKQPQSATKSPLKGQPSPKKKTLAGGVQIEDIREGQGPVAKPGKLVSVYYEGRLKQNNKIFDSSNRGSGFSFRLGGGEVIKGWDIGVAGMKTGGRRRVICPPAMAYGAKGSPPVIPANSHLVFEIELRKVR